MSDTLLVAVSCADREASLVRFAARLAVALDGEILLLHVVEVPPPVSFSEGTVAAVAARQRLERAAHEAADIGARSRFAVRVARDVADEIRRVAHEERVRLVLCGWGVSADAATGEFGPVAEALLANPPADLAIVHPPPGDLRRVLVAVRGGPYAALAVDLGTRLAAAEASEMNVLHVYHPEGIEESLIPEARQHDLLILGAHGPPEAGAGRAEDSPSRLNFTRIRDRVGRGVMIVRTRQPLSPWIVQRPEWSPALVDKWFAENTFDAREFADLNRLVGIKRSQGITISLCLPALNEAETIGPIIQVMRDALVDAVPLLDEIVVIDSCSEDGTPDIARSLGVPVYVHPEILPGYGTYRGKGEALWKSLYALRGDLIVWLDTDIKNPEPHLVYGLIGSLLFHPQLKFVKGYYSRPVKVGDRLYESGGGRVTELAARPLLNFFFPELAGFIQPLAGLYAGWRHALERVPFFTGYGVEIGLLIDLLADHGLEGMGQVNLGRVVHRNAPLSHLSTMSFAILQVIVKRLQCWGRLTSEVAVNTAMKLIRWEGGRLALDLREIDEAERPPMATIPEYRARRLSL
ncbi:MAG: glucosyl-3-phosphoglycerate synthase [bacterium JZ-2024 1]